MKVAIVAFNNIKYSPYVKTYSNLLDERNISYDVIIPNRNGFEEKLGETLYALPWDAGKHKALNFLSFASSAKKILKKNKYDFVFVLTTMPAVLLSSFLVRNYKNRYLVDVRDYTYEGVKLYALLEEKVLKHAAARVISSLGFQAFLPQLDYLLCHNTSYDLTRSKQEFQKKKDGPIRIGYVGSVAYAPHCKKVIDLVDQDERFEVYFYGNETRGTEVSSYVAAKNNPRIRFFGPYNPEDKEGIVESVDILFNVYGNATPLVKYAVSNKLYDAFYFKKPLLTSPETIMSELAGEFSFDIDASCDSAEALYTWYQSRNGEEMISYMNSKLLEYANDVATFRETVDRLVSADSKEK